MTPTNDQIVAEANRRATERGWNGPPVEHYIIEVTREGWTPPPVDPEVLAVREVLARPEVGGEKNCDFYLAGTFDSRSSFQMALAAYKAGREVEAERAQVVSDALVEALDDYGNWDYWDKELRQIIDNYRAAR